MRRARFEAPLFEGHKGVRGVLVPFDPEAVWRSRPVRLAGRRHGWLVSGTANGARFHGYVGERWGRYFITLDEALLDAAGVTVGETVTMVVAPASTRAVYDEACRQSLVTTQPGRARADAVEFSSGRAPGRKPAARKPRRRAPTRRA